MQAVSGTVKADIGRNDLLRGLFIKPLDIGRLMHVAAFCELLDEVRLVGHGGRAFRYRRKSKALA